MTQILLTKLTAYVITSLVVASYQRKQNVFCALRNEDPAF